MNDQQHKSSEELIREANRKLRSPQDDPPPDAGRPANALPTEPDASMPGDSREASWTPARAVPDQAPPDQVERTEPPSPAAPAEPVRGSRAAALALRFGLGIVVFAGIGFFSSLDDASRDGAGELVSAGDLDVMELQVGDCFDDPEELDEVVFDVSAVPCSEAHDNEVFSLVPVTVFGAAFPGETALQDFGYESCVGEPFRTYVGTEYFDSALEVFTFTPTEESWDGGDREVVCILYKLDLTKLVGTARGSGL